MSRLTAKSGLASGTRTPSGPLGTAPDLEIKLGVPTLIPNPAMKADDRLGRELCMEPYRWLENVLENVRRAKADLKIAKCFCMA